MKFKHLMMAGLLATTSLATTVHASNPFLAAADDLEKPNPKIAVLEEQVVNLQAALATAKQDMPLLRQENTELDAKVKRLGSDLEAAQEAFSELEASKQELEEGYQREVAAKQQAIEGLQAEIAVAPKSDAVDALNDKIAELNREKEQLERDHETALEESAEKLAAAEQKAHDLGEDLKAARQEYAQLQARFAGLEKDTSLLYQKTGQSLSVIEHHFSKALPGMMKADLSSGPVQSALKTIVTASIVNQPQVLDILMNTFLAQAMKDPEALRKLSPLMDIKADTQEEQEGLFRLFGLVPVGGAASSTPPATPVSASGDGTSVAPPVGGAASSTIPVTPALVLADGSDDEDGSTFGAPAASSTGGTHDFFGGSDDEDGSTFGAPAASSTGGTHDLFDGSDDEDDSVSKAASSTPSVIIWDGDLNNLEQQFKSMVSPQDFIAIGKDVKLMLDEQKSADEIAAYLLSRVSGLSVIGTDGNPVDIAALASTVAADEIDFAAVKKSALEKVTNIRNPGARQRATAAITSSQDEASLKAAISKFLS